MGILITQIQIYLLGLTSVSSLLAYPSFLLTALRGHHQDPSEDY